MLNLKKLIKGFFMFKTKYRTRHCKGCKLEHKLLGCVPKSKYCKSRRKIVEKRITLTPNASADDYELIPGYIEPDKGAIEQLIELQKEWNSNEAAICEIMAIPAGIVF